MSNMTVSMKLSLEDGASGPLRAFMESVQGLEAVISTLNGKFAKFAAGAGKIAASADTASLGTAKLEAAMQTMNAVMQSVGERAATASASFERIGIAAASASAGVAGASTNMQGAGTHIDTVRNKVDGLSTSLRGMVELWAAFKVERGLNESVGAAAEYQNTITRLKNLNVGGQNERALTYAADQTSKAIPQTNRNQSLELGIDLVNAMGSVKEAADHLTQFAKLSYVMKAATPSGQTFNERDMLMIAKVLEQRGATMDPARMQAEMDMMAKIYTGTQGRVDAKQLLGNVQYSKGGLGNTMELGFMPIFASMIEQVKSGGGNGGQIGTALTSLQQAIVGGVIKQSALINWEKMGLIDPSKEVWNKVGTLKGVQAGGIAGSDSFQKNPYEWVQKFLVPALKRSGIDTKDSTAVNAELAHLFGNRNAANIASMMITRQPQLEKDSAIIKRTGGVDEQYNRDIKTAAANMEAFKAAVHNLAIAMGTTLLPIVTNVVQAFAGFVSMMSDFAQNNPALAQFIAMAAAVGSVVLAIAGMKKIFGIVVSLSGLLGGVGTAATVAEGAVAVAATGMISKFALIGKMMLRIIPVIGELAMAWELGGWISNLKVGSRTIGEHIAKMMDGISTSVMNGWERIKSFFRSGYTDIEAQTNIASNNMAHKLAFFQSGVLGAKNHINSGYSSIADHYKHTATDGNETTPVYAPGKLFAGGGKGGGIGGGVKAAKGPKYNAAAEQAKQDYKLEEYDLKTHLDIIKQLYDKGKEDAAKYYADKQSSEDKSFNAEIAQLQRQEAALTAAHDRKQAKEVQTQILLKQREQARNRALNNEALATAQDGEATKAIKDKVAAIQAEITAIKARDDAYKLQEDRIHNASEAGAITPSDAQTQTIELRRKQGNADLNSVASLRDMIDLLQKEKLLHADKAVLIDKETAGLVKQVDQMQRAGQKLAEQQSKEFLAVKSAAQSGFDNFFMSLMKGGQSAKEMFRSLLLTILDGIEQVIAKKLAEQATNAFMGGSNGSGGASGIGGMIAGFLGSSGTPKYGKASGDQLAQLNAQDAGVSGGSSSGSWIGTAASIIGSIFGGSFATGADNIPNDMVAQIHKGEMIIPKDAATAIRAGSNSKGSFSQHISFVVPAPTDMRTQQQIATLAYGAGQKAYMRNA